MKRAPRRPSGPIGFVVGTLGLVGVLGLLATGCDGGTVVSGAGLDAEDPGIDGSVCGDGRCDEDGNESCLECPADCGACAAAVCGDGACSTDGGETCTSCAADCGPCVGCGDGACDVEEDETCASCAADCGACDPCGDDLCDGPAETCATCPADCGRCRACGDGACDEDSETCTSCPADCEVCDTRRGCSQGTFHAYHGNLHAHTSYSDGVQTPARAFAMAKANGLDFQWVTDHKGPMGDRFGDCKDEANTANARLDAFVAGCGWEVALASADETHVFGHYNALFVNTRTATPAGLQQMYETFAACDPCVGMWNHPPWPGRFGDYQFFPVGKPAMRLIELSGGGEWAQKMAAYFEALRKGWSVSPAANEDNHHANWGASSRATGVWATELTRPAIREAIRANRTFATFDDTATIAFKGDGCWMGSHLRGTGRIELTIVARDRQDGDRWRRIELLGTQGGVLDSKACAGPSPCTATFTRNPDGPMFWVAKAIQEDGDVLVSAPIWLDP